MSFRDENVINSAIIKEFTVGRSDVSYDAIKEHGQETKILLFNFTNLINVI